MIEFLLVVLVITVINAIEFLAIAYLAVKWGWLPGVEWYWPWQKRK